MEGFHLNDQTALFHFPAQSPKSDRSLCSQQGLSCHFTEARVMFIPCAGSSHSYIYIHTPKQQIIPRTAISPAKISANKVPLQTFRHCTLREQLLISSLPFLYNPSPKAQKLQGILQLVWIESRIQRKSESLEENSDLGLAENHQIPQNT